jgi:hypothetical protein
LQETFKSNGYGEKADSPCFQSTDSPATTSALEDGDDMFLQNTGIDLQFYTVSKPKTSTTTTFIILVV